jgi:Protein of unknown function (DUF3892)
MAAQHEVLCINKSDRFDPHERILGSGGRNADGTVWALSQKDAIDGIESDKWSFYVRRGVHMVSVIVSKSRYGHK